MSTVRANNYYDASGGSNAQLYGVASPPNSMGFRNRLLNPGMVIDQRNAGASVTPVSGQYLVDRWRAGLSAASKYSVQQNAGSVTPPTGFSNYLGATSLSAYAVSSGDIFFLGQRIEGFNTSDLGFGTASAQTITVSFWVRSSLTGTFCVAIGNGAYNRSYVTTYSVSAANTWEFKTVTIPGDTTGTWVGATNGIGLHIEFSLGAGSTYQTTANTWAAGEFYSVAGAQSVVGTNGATFYITGVQLEAGTVASPFERRDYGRELMMCQRYFQNVIAQYLGPAVNGANNGGGGQFLVEMRAAPTVTWVSNIAALNFPTTAPVGYYLSPTTRNFWPYKTANGTGQDSRFHDNYTASAEL